MRIAADANNPVDLLRPNNRVIQPADPGRRNDSGILNRDLIEMFEPRRDLESELSLDCSVESGERTWCNRLSSDLNSGLSPNVLSIAACHRMYRGAGPSPLPPSV
jgi:hypothetical protein